MEISMKLHDSFGFIAFVAFLGISGGRLAAQSPNHISPAQARSMGIFSPRDTYNATLMAALAQKMTKSTGTVDPLAVGGTLSRNLGGGTVSPKSFITFDVPGGQYTTPSSINFEGDVTGYFFDINFVQHGFIRSHDGKVVSFDVSGDVNGVYPVAINDFGVVAGYFIDVNSGLHGFVRYSNCPASNLQKCTILTFDAPNASPVNYYGTYPSDINLQGDITGSFDDANGLTHGFIRWPSGAFTIFDGPGATQTFPAGMNLEGVVTGAYFPGASGFVRAPNGTITPFSPPNSTATFPAAINIGGAITGEYSEPFDNPFTFLLRGFLRTLAGEYQTFDAATYTPCCIFTTPTSINDFGTVTGNYNDGYNIYHGFLRTSDGTIHTFDAPGAGTGNFQGTHPESINLAGTIAGYYTDSLGIGHGFLLNEALNW
jgi:hypothetical protein